MIEARFVHIPKTAGTTVLSIMNLQYPGAGKFVFSRSWEEYIARWNELSDSEKSKLRIISGHVPLRTGIPIIDEAPSFTILRDPMQRAASFCRHALDPKKGHYLWEKGIRDLDTLLDNPVRELRNLQTKILVNPPGATADDDFLVGGDHSEILAKAKVVLTDQLVAYGFQEKFDQSVVHIARAFGRRPPVYLTKNQSDRSMLVDFMPDQLAKLEALNALDIEIYDFARKRFQQEVEKSDWLDGEMKRFRR